jgi:hypothetical protein
MKIWGASHGSKGPGIFLDEMPFWYFLLMRFCGDFCSWFYLHDLLLPNWPRCCGDKEAKEDNDGRYYTPQEYYGDLGCLWDHFVLNSFVNKLSPRFVKSVWIPLTEEQAEKHPNLDDRIFWMQETRRWIEYEARKAKREAARDNDQSELSRPDAGGTGTSTR